MPNYEGNLAGWSDPEDPDWLANLSGSLMSESRRRNRRGMKGRYLEARPPFFHLLRIAANKRGIPMASYMRRAVAAFIAHDLDLTEAEILQHTPYPKPAYSVEKFKQRPDDGTGFGPWHIDTLT